MDEESLHRLREIHSLFNVMHQNFEYRLLRATEDQILNQKIFQAQAISRLGFVIDEINLKNEETITAIENRANEIANNGNGTDAECIVNARGALENAAEYSGESVSSAVTELFYYLNQLKNTEFYPLVNTLLLESNELQWTVVFEVNNTNVVSNWQEFFGKLEFDYDYTKILFENSMNNLDFEMNLFEDGLNEIKRSYFPELNSFRDYFFFQASLISNDLPNCDHESFH